MRISAVAAILMMFVGAALLHPSGPAVAQEPQALTPSPEPPSPTTAPTATPEVVPPPPPIEPTPGPPTATPGPERSGPDVDLVVSKSVNPSVVLPGQLLTFSITVLNQGNDPADGVVVTDVLPEVLSVSNATTTRGIIAVAGQTVTVEIGRLQAGEEVSITIEALVLANAPQNGYTNRVSVGTGSAERGTDNNAAQASFAVGQQATAVPPTPTAIPASPTAAPSGTPSPGEPCERTAAGGAVPTCTPVPGTPAPPHPTAAPPPKALPDTGASLRNTLGLLLFAGGALGLGLALRRRRVPN